MDPFGKFGHTLLYFDSLVNSISETINVIGLCKLMFILIE